MRVARDLALIGEPQSGSYAVVRRPIFAAVWPFIGAGARQLMEVLLIRRLALLAALALTLAGATGALAASEAAAVRQSFHGLKTALLQNRGEDAAGLVSQSTLALTEQARDLALYGTQAELEVQPTALLVAALSLRQSIPPQELQSMPAHDLVAHVVNTDLTRDAPVAGIDIGGVRVDRQTALADVVSSRPFPVSQLRFNKEQGVWKLDLHDVAYGDTAIDRVARRLSPGSESGQRALRNEMILAMIAMQSGGVDASIWQPPFRRP